jgi:hypothetical protein
MIIVYILVAAILVLTWQSVNKRRILSGKRPLAYKSLGRMLRVEFWVLFVYLVINGLPLAFRGNLASLPSPLLLAVAYLLIEGVARKRLSVTGPRQKDTDKAQPPPS